MEVVYIIVALLLAIVISDILSKVFPKVPVIFFQVIIGVLISYLPFFEVFELNPELFMIIIIKPLIFSEAQKFSMDELKKYFNPIVSLSVPLVIVTVFVTVILINLIFPNIPIFTIFILASMVIPTNSGVIKSISENLQFPKDALHILEGESLFNDSIGILMFDLALSASIANTFHLHESIFEFLYVILGGLIVGIILGFIISHFRYWIVKNNFENASMMVIIQIITPFVVYLIAEEYIHVSGILAVIISGMVHGYERPILNLKSTKLQVISDSTWNVIDYVLDGLVALMLGISLPEVIINISVYNLKEFRNLILISVLVYLVVAFLRFLWVTLQPNIFRENEEESISKSINGLIYALSGVRGTITLVIAFSIPIITDTGKVFLFREELIFIAAMVILISLITPTIVFPVVIPKKDENDNIYDFNEIRKKMINHTIFEMENNNKYKDDYSLTIALKILRDQLMFLDDEYTQRGNREEIEKILDETTKVRIKATEELVNQNKISKNVGIFYKAYLMHLNKKDIVSALVKLKIWRAKRKLKVSSNDYKSDKDKFIEEFLIAQEHSCKAALSYLNDNINNNNYASISIVIEYYQKKLENNIDEFKENSVIEDVKTCLGDIFQIENTFVQDYLENGLISPTLANELIEQISYDELIYYKSI